MLNSNVFVAVSENDSYSSFLENLKYKFDHLQLFYEKESLIKSLEFLSQNQSYLDNNIFIVFTEAEFAPGISKFLKENLDDLNYILVCLSTKEHYPDAYMNVYDYIQGNHREFDPEFFFNRLKSEIQNKSRMTALKVQIREFYEIGKLLSSEKDIFKLFDMIINTSLNITKADAVTLYMVTDKNTDEWSVIENGDHNNKNMKFVISKNLSMNTDLQSFTTNITKKSIYGYTAINGKAVRIDDAYHISPELEYRHDSSFDCKTGYKTVSILSIPMKDRYNNVNGVIQLINKKRERGPVDFTNGDWVDKVIPFDYFDELTMNSIAGQAAVALENNILYRNMNRLLQQQMEQNEKLTLLSNRILKAHEEERKRIAREIHDGPAQSAACLALKLELCKRQLQKGALDDLSKEMDKLGLDIRSAVKDIRSVIYDLKPSYLEDGLFSALQNHIEVFCDNNPEIQVNYQVSGDDSGMEHYIVSTVYRIAQEALTNINKHAQANEVSINVSVSSHILQLDLQDNGKGFNTDILKQLRHTERERGFGIEGMKERVELINGSIQIESLAGKGTTIYITVPLT